MNEQRRTELEAGTPYTLQRACQGKTRFPSKKNAAARARALGGEWSGYRCPRCHHWHIGHNRVWTEFPPERTRA
jgi:hypothetical protein